MTILLPIFYFDASHCVAFVCLFPRVTRIPFLSYSMWTALPSPACTVPSVWLQWLLYSLCASECKYNGEVVGEILSTPVSIGVLPAEILFPMYNDRVMRTDVQC